MSLCHGYTAPRTEPIRGPIFISQYRDRGLSLCHAGESLRKGPSSETSVFPYRIFTYGIDTFHLEHCPR
jgi:hypothetical protein